MIKPKKVLPQKEGYWIDYSGKEARYVKYLPKERIEEMVKEFEAKRK